jgi:hypothetical protein
MNEAKSDRFFRAMVLMGSAVAFGCGGSTSRSSDGSGGSGPTGTGGTGGSGGSGSGGSGPGGTGGTALIDPTNGTATTAAVDPGPFPCVPAQMECSSVGVECSPTYDGWRIPEGCSCSETRPESAADCGSDQSFVCLWGTERADGTPYTEPVPFECSCVDPGLTCSNECYAAGWGGDVRCDSIAGEGGAAGASSNETLCGCAFVVLK